MDTRRRGARSADMGPAWAALVEAMPFPVLVAGPSGVLVGGNGAAERLLGRTWKPDPAQQREPDDLDDCFADPAVADRVRTATAEAAPGEARAFDVDLNSVAGERIPARLYATAVRDADGRIAATVAIFQDLRAERALQRNLEEATRQSIDAERRSGQQAQGSKLAHELNQPLTVAMVLLEMLSSGPDLDPALVRRLAKIHDQLDRIKKSILKFREESRSPDSRG